MPRMDFMLLNYCRIFTYGNRASMTTERSAGTPEPPAHEKCGPGNRWGKSSPGCPQQLRRGQRSTSLPAKAAWGNPAATTRPLLGRDAAGLPSKRTRNVWPLVSRRAQPRNPPTPEGPQASGGRGRGLSGGALETRQRFLTAPLGNGVRTRPRGPRKTARPPLAFPRPRDPRPWRPGEAQEKHWPMTASK
eukprot:620373-Pyramimonas_sp.AAC.2